MMRVGAVEDPDQAEAYGEEEEMVGKEGLNTPPPDPNWP